MQHPDEGMIHTWLDGELPAEEAAALEAHVAECEQCKASVAEARGFIAASSRIVGALDNVPGGVIPVVKPVKRVWYSSPQFRAAAAVLIVAGASFLVMRPNTRKSTLAASGNTEMADVATEQRVMSAPNPAVAAAPSAVQPPTVADQTLSKKEAAKPATIAPSKGLAARSAPVRELGAARIPQMESKVSNEADFSGRGVKGGSAAGVEGSVLSGKVAGVEMKAADALSARPDFRRVEGELQVVRVDSTATTKRTTYQSLSGSEVVLTEESPAPILSKVAASNSESIQRAAPAPALPPVVANAPVPSAPLAQRAPVVHNINWVDPATRRRYSLSGPVSVEELEAIKAKILQARH